MRALEIVSGLGKVRIGARWVESYFRYESVVGEEYWTVRVGMEDFDALGLLLNVPARLQLPQHAERDVVLRKHWQNWPHVWMEFGTSPPNTNISVDASEVMSDR